MDKVSNNAVIICKTAYINTILKELNNPNVYKPLNFNDIDKLITNLQQDLAPLGIPQRTRATFNSSPPFAAPTSSTRTSQLHVLSHARTVAAPPHCPTCSDALCATFYPILKKAGRIS